jgi:hypothetical protein
MSDIKNREDWLEHAVKALKPLFDTHNIDLPSVHVSVSFPSSRALSTKKRTIGEHWKPHVSASGLSQVFISPVLSDPIDVLATLVHELVHAVHPDAKHKGDFVRTARKVGLEGKPTATVAGDALRAVLQDISEALGPYPHPAFDPLSLEEKKQKTRMIKLECAQGSGYIARTVKKWLQKYGAPACPCHKEPMAFDESLIAEEPGEEEDGE